MKNNRYILLLIAAVTICLTGCGHTGESNVQDSERISVQENSKTKEQAHIENENDTENTDLKLDETDAEPEENSLLNPEGMTLAARITEPASFKRKAAKSGSLLDFLRNYPMKEDGSPVLLYDQTLKSSQEDHVAVFQLPIEQEDLQQCADSVMRVYAEYFWNTGQYERIAFHFTDGFYAEYTRWREGYRIQLDGNQTEWVKTAGYDDSYENFQKYLRIVFAYAGTLSMEAESEEIRLEQIQAGDIFLKGGSPGHVVMVADICKNAQGKKAFLLAQGYMPAQEFHVLKNPMHENDPWYYEEEIEYPFVTPEYTFGEGSLRRLKLK